MGNALSRLDRAAFALVARHHWPGADRVLPRLSRAANHGVLWLGAAAGMAAVAPGARRAALRGVASLALASAVTNTVGKRTVRRARPVLDAVPLVRRLGRQPLTTSFPSGHSASAAAFATGVALESAGWGAAVAPLAASVAFSRVYTGVHYPADVVAGAALGVTAALVVRRLVPSRLTPPEVRRVAPVPRLPGGRGLVVVANLGSGASGAGEDVEPGALVRAALPAAEVLECGVSGGPTVPEALAEAARRAKEAGGALGVFGGDGTVSAAARTALAHDLPLAVLPGGTLNHFAGDLGTATPADVSRAVEAGEAVAVDVGRFGEDGHFVNTFALGVYPELVRERERWSPRVGSWPAGVIAAWRVLRECRPVELTVNGRRHQVWLLFAGNCRYEGLGLAPQRRADLADGLLDVRVAHAGRWARTRLLAGALAGTLHRSPVHGAALVGRLRVEGIEPGTRLAYDGEVAEAPSALVLEKRREALRVYCPHATTRLSATPL
ncbi:bifunctional phosphatase PAP2/diacylglycerol kinase family protein [Streptomyces alkaliterrae]|uniref:Phosphatase PAP2 family protein n=1 Tax=Streptomyces alkaliterrae TaxID=2213162 RepID=A0A5P0YML4_9ACTN|nr:bifunctional phosphatase PAP2/diacylglycerol kinase family protein [Streptomyces alkaliterrae]MBB1257713.1 phosphatase PAP2 family protein [Streptomyces alkaliterrae]MQS00652.1 phosphatase PAP2 family protein [Streptomyces alkaliterrae]